MSEVQNGGANTVTLNVSWENSWKVTTGPANHDAAWIFFKYQDCASGAWKHADISINANERLVLSGDITIIQHDSKGIYIVRVSEGIGNVTGQVQLKLVLPAEEFNIKVFALEMVSVPTDEFYVGDAAVSDNFRITKIDKTFQDNANVYSSYSLWGPAVQNLPVAYPKGYYGFYCMKYEVTQAQYVGFLNTLSFDHQASRTIGSPSIKGTRALVKTAPFYRNGISVKEAGTLNNIPAEYGCDLNSNGVYGEADDGGAISCNFLSWDDLLSYLDWASLRPMSEFEFEKICRGPASYGPSVAREFAWGTKQSTMANSENTLNKNLLSETSSINGPGLCAYGIVDNSLSDFVYGPMRGGFAATSSTNREMSGASFYGVMDMSGNVWEQAIVAQSSAFTRTNGDGILSPSGSGNTAGWPVYSMSILRGGSFSTTNINNLTISDRTMYPHSKEARSSATGGRGIRSVF